MIINRIYETKNLLSLVSFLVGLRIYQHPCITQCNPEASVMRMPWPHWGLLHHGRKRKTVALRTGAGAVWTLCATAGRSMLPQLKYCIICRDSATIPGIKGNLYDGNAEGIFMQ
jgi:hypothetical protein